MTFLRLFCKIKVSGPLLVLVAVLLAAGTAACGGGDGGGSPSPSAGNRPPPAVTVTTTFPVFADFVREAGGDRVEVLSVLPDGLDPELRELSADQIERLGRSDLVLYNGLELEKTAEDLLFQHRRRGSQIIAYANDVNSPTQEGVSALQARDNPYLWLDPVLVRTYVDTTWDSLVIVDGEAINTYRTNADRYKQQLTTLNEEIETKLQAIPPENRKLVAVSEAFFHLANRYGLESVSLPTPVSTDEPSPRRVQEWAELFSQEDVPAVFTERGFSSKLLTQAAQTAGVEICSLYSDSLDDEVTTYIDMMTFNADELVRCLGGE